MNKRILGWGLLFALVAALFVTGHHLLFSTFKGYDDEGYVLISLKNFSANGGLYDSVYTQYGPFPYFFYHVLHEFFGFAFTNTGGRWITLICWIGTAALCAMIVGRETRSFIWAGFTLSAVFVYLWTMIHEPAHPGGLLSLLVALGTGLGAWLWSRKSIGWFTVAAALVGAALSLTKINVGVFFIGATFSWLAVNTANLRTARVLTWLVAVGIAFLPFGLMRALQDQNWVRIFGLVFICGGITALLSARQAAQPLVQRKHWMMFIVTLTAALVVGSVATLMRGTSAAGLIHGILLDPLKHPGVYFFPMGWAPGTGVIGLCSLGFVGLSMRGRWNERKWFNWVMVTLRLLVLIAFLGPPLHLYSLGSGVWGMSYGVTLAGLLVLPLYGNASPTLPSISPWVALVLVFQCLHAYPVAGTQINWGSYLSVPVMALGLADSIKFLRSQWDRRRAFSICLGFGGVAVAGVTVLLAYQLFQVSWYRYKTIGNPDLDIPGAERLRLDGEQTYILRILNENLRAQSDMVFTLPGLYSVNLWTNLPTPTLANATHWFSLLSETQQQAIIQRLAASPRAALVVQRDLVNYLIRTGFSPHGTLYRWLMENFTLSLSLDGYEVWFHKGRNAASLSVARIRSLADESRELTVILAPTVAPITRIELCDYNAPQLPLVVLGSDNATVTAQSVALDGNAEGPPRSEPFPVSVATNRQISVRYTQPKAQIAPDRTLVIFRDGKGNIVREARVLQ